MPHQMCNGRERASIHGCEGVSQLGLEDVCFRSTFQYRSIMPNLFQPSLQSLDRLPRRSNRVNRAKDIQWTTEEAFRRKYLSKF